MFEKYANYCVKACSFCNFLYIACGLLTLVNPLIVKFFTGKIVLPYGFKLPWTNQVSVTGYALNFLHHLLQDFIVVTGFVYTDGIYITVVLHMYCLFDILLQSLKELNDSIAKLKESKTKPHIREQLMFVIKVHTELYRFAEKIRISFMNLQQLSLQLHLVRRKRL